MIVGNTYSTKSYNIKTAFPVKCTVQSDIEQDCNTGTQAYCIDSVVSSDRTELTKINVA